jgi:hypothetical protein
MEDGGSSVARRSQQSFLIKRSLLSVEYALRRLSRTTPDARTLLRDGYLVVPNFLDATQLLRIQDALPPVESCEPSPEGTMTQTFYEADGIAELSPFFKSERIAQAMRGALGKRAECLRTAVQYRHHLGETGAFEQFFHIDTWLPRFKAFLYLSDVDEGGGPLRYVPGSNRGRWRLGLERDVYRLYPDLDGYIADPDAAFVGCVWPHQARKIARRLNTKPRSFTGPAGTLVLFDARGLHATTPLSKPRTILYSYWTKPGHHT